MEKQMSEKELRDFIRESLSETSLSSELDSEDQSQNDIDFADSLAVDGDSYENDINYGLDNPEAIGSPMNYDTAEDKAALRQGGDESYNDEFSDLNGYTEFGSDYQLNPEDMPSIAPQYFNENMELTQDELEKLIKEGVERFHKQTLIENRLNQINQELNALSNPEAWEDARQEAQAQLRKKNIAWTNLTQKERLVSENKYSKKASDFIGKEISHLIHDKDYEHDRAVAAAINIAKDKGYKIPEPTNEEAPSAGLSKKEKSNIVKKAKAGKDIGKPGKGFDAVVANAKKSGVKDPEAVAAAAMWKSIKRETVNEIMSRANNLMAEANKKLN
jgi:hypothetical protein